MRFATRSTANKAYAKILTECPISEKDAYMAHMGRTDLWFLLVFILNRYDMNGREGINSDWLYDRCKEVYENPNGMLDLWSREHYKSTIITFGLTIQDILNNPEMTFGIFSVKRELAQDFLKQIKQEFEDNELLKHLYPDVLYANPDKESPCWGIDKGIRVKRRGNSREETVEAWGLFGGMPTGKHFKCLVYDDVVTEKSVTNPDQLAKAFDMMRLSFSLGSHGGIRRMIGTRYHYNDAWGSVIKAGTAEERVHRATEDGTPTGKPVMITPEALAEKRRDMGNYIYACQLLQNPKADEAQGFSEAWLSYYHSAPNLYEMNLVLLCDPASSKKKGSDYTVMVVIGLAPDGNYYLIDGMRDRLNLTERTKALMRFQGKYKPIAVGYERYGKDSDIEHIEDVMERTNRRFHITELGGSVPKNDRIRKLIPLFEQHRFWLPNKLTFVDIEGKIQNFVETFREDEYLAFPVSAHDDMLDCIARVVDPTLELVFPTAVDNYDYVEPSMNDHEEYDPFESSDYDPLG